MVKMKKEIKMRLKERPIDTRARAHKNREKSIPKHIKYARGWKRLDET